MSGDLIKNGSDRTIYRIMERDEAAKDLSIKKSAAMILRSW
jgi:hypothetical protein